MRHNLSSNDCFIRLSKISVTSKKGKGSYWIINENMKHLFVENNKARRPRNYRARVTTRNVTRPKRIVANPPRSNMQVSILYYQLSIINYQSNLQMEFELKLLFQLKRLLLEATIRMLRAIPIRTMQWIAAWTRPGACPSLSLGPLDSIPLYRDTMAICWPLCSRYP